MFSENSVSSIIPDWVLKWTAKEAEEKLEGFNFSGPGWYLLDGDTILVLPSDGGELDENVLKGSPWAAKSHWSPEHVFKFFIYDGRNPANAFNAIANAPTRMDAGRTK